MDGLRRDVQIIGNIHHPPAGPVQKAGQAAVVDGLGVGDGVHGGDATARARERRKAASCTTAAYKTAQLSTAGALRRIPATGQTGTSLPSITGEKMKDKAKKFKSKWFRVAVEGATTDGREIQRGWIQEMADQYNPETYGARVNCEHLKTFMPRGDFGAYGDVLALKAEEVEIGGVKKLALFAQIEPTPELIALNKEKQKIYTSIEVNPKFSDTGKAYLVGLAVTDSPASLGTEALEFSAKHGTMSNRKQHADNLFTAAEEAALEFTEEQDSALTELKAKITELFRRTEKASKEDPALFAQLADVLSAALDKHEEEYSALSATF